jgi:hypothetical protein
MLYLASNICGPQNKIKGNIFNHSCNNAHNFIAKYCIYPQENHSMYNKEVPTIIIKMTEKQ